MISLATTMVGVSALSGTAQEFDQYKAPPEADTGPDILPAPDEAPAPATPVTADSSKGTHKLA